MEEVEALAEQYYNMLDTDIASLTRKQYDQMLLQHQWATNSLQRAREFVANKNTVNPDLSTAF
jgi:hypothetical protein